MKRFFIITVKGILLAALCVGVLISCDDDDDDDNNLTISGTLVNADPSYGFIGNSTEFRLQIDLGEKEDFTLNLAPGQIIGVQLKENKTYILHVVVLNQGGGALSEYVNSFFIDDIPLDNQFKDVLCSWYVEFVSNYPEYGFGNEFGT